MVYVPLVLAACGSLEWGTQGLWIIVSAGIPQALGKGPVRGLFQDAVAQLLSISAWDGLKVLCAWILLVAVRDGAFLFSQ